MAGRGRRKGSFKTQINTGRGRARQSALTASESMGIGFEGDIGRQLRDFADDIRDNAMRPAAFAAATVLYDEMKLRAPVGPTGNLQLSIYRFRDKNDGNYSNQRKSIFTVGPNKKIAPHWHWIEYGNVNQAAQPYIRPAYDAKINEAMNVAKTVLAEKIKDLV